MEVTEVHVLTALQTRCFFHMYALFFFFIYSFILCLPSISSESTCYVKVFLVGCIATQSLGLPILKMRAILIPILLDVTRIKFHYAQKALRPVHGTK